MKKLYRLRKEKIIGGVCGGLGRYFNIDPVIVRLLWAVAFLLGGVGFLAYIIAWIVIPEEPLDTATPQTESNVIITQTNRTISVEIIIGAILVLFGLVSLGSSLGWFNWQLVWKIAVPSIVVLVGLFVVVYAIKRKES